MMASLSRLFGKWLYNTKLRHKIMLTYLALIVFPLGIFQYAASDRITAILKGQVTYSAEQGFEQTYAYLSYRVQRIAKTTDVLVGNPSVANAIQHPLLAEDINEQMEQYIELKQLMISARDNLDIYRVVMYVPDTFLYARELENFLPLSLSEGSPCLERLKNDKQKYTWCMPETSSSGDAPTSAPVLSVVRNILDPNDYSTSVGMLRVDVDGGQLKEILRKANVVKNSVTMLYDRGDGVILSSDPVSSSLTEPLANLAVGGRTDMFTRDGIYYLTHPVPYSQWSMVTVIPMDEVMKQSRQLREQLLLLLIGIAAAAYAVAYVLAISVTRRISKLTRRIRVADTGQLPDLSPVQGRDEIGELIQTYNYMIKKIALMNEQQYLLGQEAKGAELMALQSQINPHFLYNTLDLINWMAARGMNDEIKNVVRTLARFYKVSLSSGRDVIAIREELDHVSFYAQIQNIRYDNQILFLNEVPEDLLRYAIPKISLQPIVENAILHGILGRENRTGTIRISGERTDAGDIRLTVEDDGIGMSAGELAETISRLHGERTGDRAYGSRNVHMRIRHRFGEPYGLTYRSAEGEGTRVEILIPATVAEEEA
ncbi:cache domain-containing sensor histidine kinase [Cohnella sp. JJ-181]|uniref:cache domain-containing sensor histidine kinase n=1 Tax=Cohnella rhizoplanae TaxID=2974897 RepID=UPI0022FF51C0|nr:sensor histidine kinase [Cohnella sp. JJ-181]CAI6085789.1 hypothetical protein COHCIP112018_04792 [Cohnella sp. JJ-181]